MASYDLPELLRKARNGTLADNHPDLETLRRHANSGVGEAVTALAEVTKARAGRGGGDVNKVV